MRRVMPVPAPSTEPYRNYGGKGWCFSICTQGSGASRVRRRASQQGGPKSLEANSSNWVLAAAAILFSVRVCSLVTTARAAVAEPGAFIEELFDSKHRFLCPVAVRFRGNDVKSHSLSVQSHQECAK